MKKVWGLLLMSLMIITQVQAAGFDCVSDEDSKIQLTINHYAIPLNSIENKSKVTVILKSPSEIELFSGTKILNTYDLKDINGESISLNVTSITNHGGRCGRCTPDLSTDYYAKLTINQNEKEFTCFPK